VCASKANVRVDLDHTLTALADPARRAVVDLLQREPRCSSALADALELSRPAMSRHLRVLRQAGLVEEASLEDDARVRVYRLRREPFSELRGWLDDVEGFWTDQLAAFKRHAEARRRSAHGGAAPDDATARLAGARNRKRRS
jgi:DNA-binding transcriptional ArsR family regulator